jgi:hypothetical protein
MDIGLHVADFTWKGGPATLGGDLKGLAQAAEGPDSPSSA